VALKVDTGDVPKVVASGFGSTAERILALAFEAGIKVREDADLAEMLAAIELDARIPLSCFEAVAEILNYLYRLNNLPLPDFMTEVPQGTPPVGSALP
jgi:flagellar biosynthesis protein